MQAVIATFDDPQTAQAAMESLIAEGFKRESMHLEAASPGAENRSTSSSTPSTDKGILASVGHFFSNLFESNTDEAGKHAEAVRRGSTVLIVDAKTDQEVETAADVMDGMGAIDLEERAATWKSQGWTGYDADAEYKDDDAAFARQAVPVVQEELQVGKRSVNVGGLRVIKRTSETPVSQIVTLRQERATVERRPVDRPATEADFSNFKEGTFEVRETAEEAVVAKTARVVEEVRVGKETTERSETVSDTVRRTDVDVERLPGDNVSRATTEKR